MSGFRTLRRLLSRARRDWHDVVEGLFAVSTKPAGPRPLRVMRLERRRVLSADFSLTASSLVLDGFNQDGDSLAITQQGDAYLFTNDEGWESANNDALPTGVSVNGDTLSVQRELLDGLSGGLTVAGNGWSPLNVTLGQADFSGANGPVSIKSPTTLGQQPLSLFSAPADGIRLGVADEGLTVSSLNIAGDLEVTSFGRITDAPDTQIIVSGDATFISNAGSPDGDFDGDGDADELDLPRWSSTYGLAAEASRYDGDANGDGRVDAVDYALYRDSVGQSLSGGIVLADNPGDRLEVGGTVTFDAAVEGRHEIRIGANDMEDVGNGWVELGAITALGSDIEIIEDAPSDLARIEANNFILMSSGEINVLSDATVLVENDATLTSRFVDYQGDFNGDGIVTADDYDDWVSNFGTVDSVTLGGPARALGNANGDDAVGALDYAIWRDDFDASTSDEPIPGGITVQDNARFEAGGLVSLVATDSVKDADGQLLPEERFAITVNDTATARFGSLALDGGIIKVVEDAGAFKAARDGNQDGTVLAGVDAEQLLLVSYGPITSIGEDDIAVFGNEDNGTAANATFASTGSIVLADQPGRDVQIDGEATFLASAGTLDSNAVIRVGVDDTGVASSALFNAGGLRFSTYFGEVRIAEDSGTILLGPSDDLLDPCIPDGGVPPNMFAGSLELESNGRIEDNDGAEVTVFEDATFRVVSEVLEGDEPAIRLADEGTDSLVVGTATFIDASERGIEVGSDRTVGPAAFEAGRLRFSAGDSGPVKVIEVGSTILATWSDATIDLLAGVIPESSTAGSFQLLSTGGIFDESDAEVEITGDATLVAQGIGGPVLPNSIALANDDSVASTNRFEVGGAATFVGAAGGEGFPIAIDVGVASDGSPAEATFLAGRIRFSSPGALVRIAEDSATQLGGWEDDGSGVLALVESPSSSVASSLELWSAGFIADDPDAIVAISGDAVLIANSDDTSGDAIRLADGPDNGNELTVGGLATFIAGEDDVENAVTGSIALGVTDIGARADAILDLGSVRFFAEGADARIADDSPTVLAGWTDATFAALPEVVTPDASEARLI
ncbi:MAG: hypothetical protein AAF266_08540 [Planctomycetota bacterium]